MHSAYDTITNVNFKIIYITVHITVYAQANADKSSRGKIHPWGLIYLFM